MLVLTRKANESIVLPDLGVTITLISTGGNRVRIGIEAPRDVIIRRGELEEKLLPAMLVQRSAGATTEVAHKVASS